MHLFQFNGSSYIPWNDVSLLILLSSLLQPLSVVGWTSVSKMLRPPRDPQLCVSFVANCCTSSDALGLVFFILKSCTPCLALSPLIIPLDICFHPRAFLVLTTSIGIKSTKGKARSATISNERNAQLVVSRMIKLLPISIYPWEPTKVGIVMIGEKEVISFQGISDLPLN
eukprot:scaffold1017_cov95-Skeletonema_dohrnii-CCMP3373.AAC.4